MIHGPGCPVCVTPLEIIDKALEIAARPDVIFCSFGDMLRVPGSDAGPVPDQERGRRRPGRLLAAGRANARPGEPRPQVVFFGIGFETTAPANAMAVYQARRLGVRELLAAGLARAGAAGDRGDHGVAELPGAGVPRRRARLQRDGHGASTRRSRESYQVPIVVTGFEPLDILEGIRRAVLQLEAGRHEVENAYARAVPAEGNPAAQAMLDEVFEVTDRAWRGIGVIPRSGWRLADGVPRTSTPSGASTSSDIHTARVADLPLGRGAAGADQAARVRGVRQGVHAAQPAGRDDGVVRGRVRGLLPLPAAGADRVR